jgi:NAD(P)-dependent dehydrogenase (short-subunit alcohol dehydrogenase family)
MSEPARAHYPSLAGRVAIVTGGASGIGEAIVRSFAEQGAKVGFIDLNAEAGTRLESELAASGAEIVFAAADITDTLALIAAIAAIRAKLGPVRVLVNNAADDERHGFAELTPESWDARLAVNLRHLVFATQAVTADMQAAGGGSIVNMSSISFMRGVSEMPAYTTAKAAIIGLTRSLAREFGAQEIRVNAVVPGWIMTDKQLRLRVKPEDKETIRREQCLKRPLVPREVANMVLFLASDDASGCTSQTFVVDGGWV